MPTKKTLAARVATLESRVEELEAAASATLNSAASAYVETKEDRYRIAGIRQGYTFLPHVTMVPIIADGDIPPVHAVYITQSPDGRYHAHSHEMRKTLDWANIIAGANSLAGAADGEDVLVLHIHAAGDAMRTHPFFDSVKEMFPLD